MSITPPLTNDKLSQNQPQHQQYQQPMQQMPFFQSFNDNSNQPWVSNAQRTYENNNNITNNQFSSQQQENHNPYSSLIFSNPNELSPFNNNHLQQQQKIANQSEFVYNNESSSVSGIWGIGGLLSKSNHHLVNTHHNSMIKFYEEEEKNIELEIKQDEKLLIVLAQEAKLTRQLSVEQLIHFAHLNQFDKKNKNINVRNNKNSDIENDENEVTITTTTKF